MSHKGLNEKVNNWLFDRVGPKPIYWRLLSPVFFVTRKLDRAKCFLVGHVVEPGDVETNGWETFQISPDLCIRCWKSEDDMQHVDLEDDYLGGYVGDYMRDVLAKHVENNTLIGRFFDWTLDHPRVLRMMPDWWEY